MVYRTCRLLSHLPADGILGRGTRVWEAYHLESGPDSKHVAIKDYWVDNDRKREGAIIKEVRNAARTEFGDENPNFKALDEHLPTILLHGDVLHSNSTSQITKTLPESAFTRNLFVKLRRIRTILDSKGEPSTEYLTSYLSRSTLVNAHSQKPLRQGFKAHYRIVMQEVGQSLLDEKSLAVAFEGIEQVARCRQPIYYSHFSWR